LIVARPIAPVVFTLTLIAIIALLQQEC